MPDKKCIVKMHVLHHELQSPAEIVGAREPLKRMDEHNRSRIIAFLLCRYRDTYMHTCCHQVGLPKRQKGCCTVQFPKDTFAALVGGRFGRFRSHKVGRDENVFHACRRPDVYRRWSNSITLRVTGVPCTAPATAIGLQAKGQS